MNGLSGARKCIGAIAVVMLLVATSQASGAVGARGLKGIHFGPSSARSAALPPSGLSLPFAANDTATYLAGPHQNRVHQCTSSAPCNSLDITPTSGVVTAAGPGVVHILSYCTPGLIVIDHLNGYFTGYYHMNPHDIRVSNGQSVVTGTPLGTLAQNSTDALPCGGTWSSPHVHFFVKYAPGLTVSQLGDIFKNSTYDVDLHGFTIGGWTIASSGGINSCMTYSNPATTVCPGGVLKFNANNGVHTGNLLSNASFEGGAGAWHLGIPGENFADYHNAAYAKDGSWFMEMNNGSVPISSGPTVYQDVSASPSVGQSYTLTLWVRAQTGSYYGVLVLWGLGGTNESAQTPFTAVSSGWRQVQVTLDVKNPGHTQLRAQIYMDTPGQNLDVDGAVLE